MPQYPNSANLDWTDSTVPGQGDELVDQQDVNFAEHVNEIRGEVKAIATELGSNPRGAQATVRARLENIESTKSGTGHNHDSAYIAKESLIAKGNILTATGAGVPAVLAPGGNGTVVMYDSAQPTGMKSKSLDHGDDLSGKGDDDHPQYLNGTRHDSRDHTNLPGVPPYPFVGMVVDSARPDVPPLWLEMNGQAVSRTTYAALFAAIDTQYGTGDGSTTFNVPNSRGRSRLTLDPTRTAFDTLGKTGGAETVTLTVAQMPQHAHGSGSIAAANVADHDHNIDGAGGHDHTIRAYNHTNQVTHAHAYSGVSAGSSHTTSWYTRSVDDVGNHVHNADPAGAHGHSTTGTTANAGSSAAHENMHPYMVFKSLIFAGGNQPSATAPAYVRYVGTWESPVTDVNADRPAGPGPVYWLCANGITPVNALDGDIIFNAAA